MGMIPGRLQRCEQTDGPEFRAVGRPRPVPGGVADPDFQWVQAQPCAELVDRALDGECGHRRPRRPIGGLPRPVADHVPADGLHIRQIVGSESRHGPEMHPRARPGAALIAQFGLPGGEGAVAPHPDFDIHAGRGSRPRRPEHLLAGHDDFYRPPGFAGQRQRHRLDEHDGLAAEPAADLGGGHPQLAGIDAEQGGTGVADHEMPLRAAPEFRPFHPARGLPRQACGSM